MTRIMMTYEALANDERALEVLLDQWLAASQPNDDSWKGMLDELRRA